MPNPALPVGEKHIIVKGQPVISTGAYSTGQCIGAPFQLANAVVGGARSGIIAAGILVDADKQDALIEAYLFADQPAGSYTDKATFNPTLADLDLLLVDVIPFAAADYKQFSANSLCKEADNMPFDTQADAKTSLWCQLVSRGTPNYTTTSSLRLHLHLEQD